MGDLVPLLCVDSLSPLHSPRLALEPCFGAQMDRALCTGWLLSALSLSGPRLAAMEPWLGWTEECMRLEFFLALEHQGQNPEQYGCFD